MIKKITIKNFKCFKNETVFDFRKTNYRLLEKNTYEKTVKGALFVGENASGKTTAIQPVKLLLDLLLADRDISLNLYQCFFSDNKITELKYEFLIGGHEINYGFSFSGNRFLTEQLEVDHDEIIDRIGTNAMLNLEKEDSFYDIDDSLLFLKRVYFNTKFSGHRVLLEWFDYLKKSVYIDSLRRRIATYNGESLTYRNYLKKYGTDKLNRFLEMNHFRYSVQYDHEKFDEEGREVSFVHEDIGISIPMFMESAGNQAFINILPAILTTVERGGMLIIDEFSSGLHNKLEELLVSYIMQYSDALQLFFVSHSTNLLSNSLLRPDQIYAVELTDTDGSKLLRFSEEQPRAAQNLEKMYLSGVFGGIPEYGIDKK